MDDELNIQLKSVFDVCDQDKCGFISVDQLAELAQQYFGGGEQDVVEVIRTLGPDNTGVVTFEEFCHGVKAIIAMHRERADSVASQCTPAEPQTYNMILTQADEQNGGRANGAGSPNGDTDNDSAILSTSSAVGSDRGSVVPPLDSLRDGSDAEEEHYECYGELSDDGYDGTSSNGGGAGVVSSNRLDPLYKPSSHVTRSSSLRSTASSNGSSSSGCPANGDHRSATLPFHRRNSWLRSSIRRSSFGAGKRNPSSVARHLKREASQNSFGHSRQSSSCDSGDDMVSSDLALEEDYIELNEKVHSLEQQVSVLAEGQHSSDDKYVKVKQENYHLTTRILMLEEQMKEIELKSEERIKEEQKRTEDMKSKLEREKNSQIENYSLKLIALEKEHFNVRDEVNKLRSLCDKLKEEKLSLQMQLSTKESEIALLAEDHRKLQELSRREREESCKERSSNTMLLNELTKEIEELRKYREESEAVARTRSPSFYEYPSRCQELEADLKSLKSKNQMLHDANEELHATLLSKSFEDGKQLLAPSPNNSLADEFDECSKDQLKSALKDSQEENLKLRSYIDKILLNIMEHYPQMLEVKGMSFMS